jgi:hypothetical protein
MIVEDQFDRGVRRIRARKSWSSAHRSIPNLIRRALPCDHREPAQSGVHHTDLLKSVATLHRRQEMRTNLGKGVEKGHARASANGAARSQAE